MTALMPMPATDSSAGHDERIGEAEMAPLRRESLSRVQIAARHADPRTTTVHDHRRQSFDRHAAYVVVAFVGVDESPAS